MQPHLPEGLHPARFVLLSVANPLALEVHMKGINYVCLSGYLGADPELHHTPTGRAVAELRLATTRKFRRDGELVEETEWNSITLWEQRADFAANYLRKGDPVIIQGRLHTEKWVSAEGEKRSKKVVIASEVTALPKRQHAAEGSPEDTSTAPQVLPF